MTFETTNSTTTTSARALPGTAMLTNISLNVANDVIKQINDAGDTYKEQFLASQKDNNAMDSLVATLFNLSAIDLSYLNDEPETTLEAMLKSQQSKRSRCKSKAMTLDNYRNLMAGAVAEILLRSALGKEKSVVASRRSKGMMSYTQEELLGYEKDQDALKREIRNLQSKKSIMKSKANFDETSEAWQQLLDAEAQLKEMKTDNVKIVDITRETLTEMFLNVDIDKLKADEARDMLKKILETISE